MSKLYFFIFYFISITISSAQYNELMQSGEKALAEKKYTAAISYYNEALETSPKEIEPSLQKITCAIQTQNLSTYETALLELEHNAYKVPVDFYIAYSNLAQQQNKNTAALTMIDKAIQKSPNNRKLLLNKVDLLDALYKTPEKLALLNRLLASNKNDAEVLYKLANSYFFSSPDKSIDLFKKLLHEKKYANIALVSLGKLYTAQYQKTNQKADLDSAYSYYKLYANSHPKDATIKKIMKELQTLK